ncbi:unnamed protein product [Symbiodinium natans]|uniref:Uncharacterized protein n=1 Tax=Symbiodinium natans TaxID=878477 RepID=A0A812Q5K1_9DINO|nr:unnamed protein product [Symbiodinium natans]
MDTDGVCRVKAHATSYFVQDPSVHAAAHHNSFLAFCIGGACMWLMAFVVWYVPVSAAPKLRLLAMIAFGLRGLGYVMEGLARIIWNETDNVPYVFSARIIVVLSLGIWILMANGLGEALWPSKRLLWLSAWLTTPVLIATSIALLILFTEQRTLVFMCTTLLVDLYWASMWAATLIFPVPSLTRCAASLQAGMLAMAALVSALPAALEETCGAPAHVSCYKDCLLVGPGWHYLLWSFFVSIFHAGNVAFYLVDPAKVDVKWPPLGAPTAEPAENAEDEATESQT